MKFDSIGTIMKSKNTHCGLAIAVGGHGGRCRSRAVERPFEQCQIIPTLFAVCRADLAQRHFSNPIRLNQPLA
jgi:hypothetical protein